MKPMMAHFITFRRILYSVVFLIDVTGASISANFINTNVSRMTFMVNFDTSSVICQRSANPEDLALYPISALCNGVRQCLASPNMDDESFPFCSHSCDPPCGPHGTCMLDGGKAQCYCDQGYSGKACLVEDTNECAKKPCHWLAKCTNTFGSYFCSCLPGFSGDGLNCTDIDECAMESIAKKCPANSECCNVPGTYFCNCTEGFKPRGQPVQACDDIDECEEKLAKCPTGTVCLNTLGSYKCTPLQDEVVANCSAGHERRDGKCVDIDECQKPDACASRAACLNTEGSYRCVCPSGFTGDGKSCTPLTDCSANSAVCHPNAFCVSDLRMCLCQSGYIGDGITCFDMNECASDHPVCKADEKCVNTNGSFVCCPRESNDRACVDAHGAMCPGGCGSNAECVGGQCACRTGYSGNPVAGCSDVNECTENPDICSPSERCVNLDGGHICCYRGAPVSKCQGLVVGVWKKKSKTSKTATPSLDEVTSSVTTTTPTTAPLESSSTTQSLENGCSASQRKYCESRSNKTCSVIDGHPECRDCLSGYAAVAGECIFLDRPLGSSDCRDPAKNDCHQHATCLSLSPTGYVCACKDGFIGDGKRCDDADECYTPNLCSPNAKCVNVVGSYRCVCNAGFAGDGHFCAAVCPGGGFPHLTSGPCTPVPDNCPAGFVCQQQRCCPSTDVGLNCEINPHICGENAKCVDKECVCISGYTRNGSLCIDVDECLDSEQVCDKSQKCVNMPGNFACCPGKTDQDKELCAKTEKNCLNGQCVPNEAPATDCRSSYGLCHPNGQCNATDGKCYCSLGYLGDGLQCKPDPEDCYLNIALCDFSRSRCVQRRCQCLDGFQGNGSNCQSESCESRPSICHRNADCTKGQCACKDGYIGNGFTCVPDPNDCDSYANLCHSQASCVARRCHCNEGFQGDGKTCSPVDAKDCRFSSSICVPNAFCNETRCHCKVGYLGDGETGCWADPEDCVVSPSRCPGTAECVERRCKCANGYIGNGTDCQLDTHDCQYGSLKCHGNARCLEDSKCRCIDGYEGDGIYSCVKLQNVEFDPRSPSDLSNATKANDTFPSGNGTGNVIDRSLCYNAALGDCHSDADCVQRDRGVYACQCRSGFTGDGRSCQDINECALRLATCHQLATCVNTAGAHLCLCPEGYRGDGIRACLRQNETVSQTRLDVECQDDGIVLIYADAKDGSSNFNGRIFVKTQSRNPYCSRDFTSSDGPVYRFKAPFAYCDTKTEPHNTFSTVVVIQKHPLFVTDADEAYNLRCTYPVGELPIMSHFNVSMLSTAGYYVNNGTMPQCGLRVLAQELAASNRYGITSADDNSNWQVITEATVGQKVQLVLNVEPKSLYGIIAKNCIAVNMDSGESYQLTNSHGCALDPAIFPEWTQDYQYQLSAKFMTFKWPDTANVRFQCDCSPCFERCEPVQCGATTGWGRKKRSPLDDSIDGGDIQSNPVFSYVLRIKDSAGPVSEQWQEDDVYIDYEEETSSNHTARLLKYYSEESTTDDGLEDVCINSVIFASALGLAVSMAASVCIVGFGNWHRRLQRSAISNPSSINNTYPSTSPVFFKHWLPWLVVNGIKQGLNSNPVTIINPNSDNRASQDIRAK